MQTQYLVLLVLYITLCIGLWKLFVKAGEDGAKAFIPFYNFYIWTKLIHKPWWWVLLLIVPGVNFLMLGVMALMLAKAFNKKETLDKTLAVLVPYLYLPFIGFQKETKYIGPEDTSKQKKSIVREWTEAIVFAVVAATIIRTFFLEAFTIPTSSLEKSLMVGDYLFVSKLSYGAKIPNTPLSFPFTHHTLPLSQTTKSYLEWIQLPYWRLPGMRKIERNDYVVFNYPDGDTVALGAQNQSYYQLCRTFGWSYVNQPNNINQFSGLPFGKVVARPADKRENYVKRCVAIAGDTLFVKHRELFINDKKAYQAPTAQFTYKMITDGNFPNRKMLDKMDITEPLRQNPQDGSIELTLTPAKAEEVKKWPFVLSLQEVIDDTSSSAVSIGMVSDIFPHSPNYNWTKDNFGPLVIPKKGMTIKLDTINIVLYDRLIGVYENNKLEVRNGSIYINNEKTDSYTFKMDYYFMMGDNRHNSADSRYWGLVPEDHIVGTPVFIWMSLKDPNNNPISGKFSLSTFFTSEGKARWNRFFTFVHNDSISKSYLLHFVLLAGAFWGYGYYQKRKKGITTNSDKKQ